MSIPIPPKPEFSKGILISTIISVLLLGLAFLLAPHMEITESALAVIILICFPVVMGFIFIMYCSVYLGNLGGYYYALKNYEKYAKREQAKLDDQEKAKREELAEISLERKEAEQSQNATEPWAVRYSTSPCPHCGHYKVRCANWEDKKLSVAFWGTASSAIGKRYKCEHCKRMW